MRMLSLGTCKTNIEASLALTLGGSIACMLDETENVLSMMLR